MQIVRFTLGTKLGFRYERAVIGALDSHHDPKGEHSGRLFFFVLTGRLAYLKNVSQFWIHCDLCKKRVQGQWFHCVYCLRDLCGDCEEVDEHDRTHFFMVAKARVRAPLDTFSPSTNLNVFL